MKRCTGLTEKLVRSFLVLGLASLSFAVNGAAIVRSASGAAAGDIQAAVDQFRSDLGTLNANVAGSFGSGRREINWDGVPDNFATPNSLPGNFFNASSPRGVVLVTPGTGFMVSANAVNPTATPIEFGNIDPSYPGSFGTFSPQRLFTAEGSNITDVVFFVPGSANAAWTNGFGVVFSDVDLANTTSLQFFDSANNSLGTFFAPSAPGSQTLSFVGVLFDAGEKVARVRIISGNQALAAGNTLEDLVVMDDFIYGEPVAEDATAPTVTVDQAVGQADPTAASPISFTVVFSEPVTGFTSADVTLGGTAGATTAVVTGSGATYNVAVSGMTSSGTVTASVAAGVAVDAANNPNAASTSTDNTVTFSISADVTPPTVTVDQAMGQADPTSGSPISFTVVFSEPVTGFTSADVTLGGTAGATTAVVTGSGATYNIAVSGMSSSGTVIASVAAGVAIDAANNPNAASTSADNTVTWSLDAAAAGTPIPTLSEWALLTVSMLILLVGAAARRRS